MQKVGPNASRWTLTRFFSELMDYCFPANYTSQLCEKLEQATQGRRPVTDFVYYLQMIWAMLGSQITEREMVAALWKGTYPQYHSSLIRRGYSQEANTFADIAAELETEEQVFKEAGMAIPAPNTRNRERNIPFFRTTVRTQTQTTNRYRNQSRGQNNRGERPGFSQSNQDFPRSSAPPPPYTLGRSDQPRRNQNRRTGLGRDTQPRGQSRPNPRRNQQETNC